MHITLTEKNRMVSNLTLMKYTNAFLSYFDGKTVAFQSYFDEKKHRIQLNNENTCPFDQACRISCDCQRDKTVATLNDCFLRRFAKSLKRAQFQNYLFSLMLRMLGTYRFKTILTILINPSQGSGSCVYK